MATFQYIASSAKGESVRGSLNAFNKSDLTKKLGAQGLFLVSCKMLDESTAAVAPPPRSTALQPAPAGIGTMAPAANSGSNGNGHGAAGSITAWFESLTQKKTLDPNSSKPPKGKIPLKELVILTRQLSISINAGMSFVDSLQGMAQNNKNPRMAWTLRHVLDDVLSGKKFSEALGQHPEIFKVFYVSMAAAGEAGGFMPEALNRIAEFLEKEMELQGKVKSAMIYPMMIGIVATVVVTGMMIFIVPTFVKVFQDMNAPLPLPTQILVVVSSFLRHGGFMAPILLCFVPTAIGHAKKRSEKFHTFYDEKVLHIPLFGKIKTLEIITRFIRTFASLTENGVMVLLSLGVSRQVVENRTIEKVVDDIYASVQQGNGISPVLYKSQYFPVLVANMVATGEKTGSIPEVLTKMANYYDAEVAAAVRDLLTMMEPMMIVVMALIVGFIIAGLMLPTFEMSSLVQ